MWDDDEQRKIYKIGKGAAYAIGGGLGMWGMKLFYPHPEGADRLSNVLGSVGWVLIIYGIIMLTVIVSQQRYAISVNRVLFWLVIPACLYYIFVNNWHG